MKKRTLLIVIVAVLLAFGFGMMLGGSGTRYEHAVASAPSRKAGASVWTCSMHPQIKQPEPGDCPLCGMDLIPLKAGVDDNGPRELTLSEGARSLADIQVQPVRRQAVVREVRMVGTIDYDERRLSTITAWVGGRLDRIFVDYTGVTVAKGDHMVWMYSPEILGAQEELLQASIAVRKMADNPLALIRNNAQATLEASRDKLRLWGLSLEQIAAIEESGKASDHIQINAPIGGVVIHKNATEGMYVKTGTPIYQIVDLSQVWAQLDAYESDLAWLRYGQEVSFESEAYPGEVFNGRVSFIDPVLSRSTRTVKVRVNVPNEDGRLKPGMFVRAILHSAVAAGGKVIDADLAGKWISPMHPEIVRDEPGPCDICGMALVRSEDSGLCQRGRLQHRGAARGSGFGAVAHRQARGGLRTESSRSGPLHGPHRHTGAAGGRLLCAQVWPRGRRTGGDSRQLQDRQRPADYGQAKYDEPRRRARGSRNRNSLRGA